MSITNTIQSALLALFLIVPTTANSQALGNQTFLTEPLVIETQLGKTHAFTAELATTGAQKQQGLMFRKNMPPNQGMLFDFGTPRPVTMWMKNTYIPLDMLFINSDGVITHIHERAVPHSEETISSRGLVKYVLELNAGTANALSIKTGDVVKSAQIGNMD